MLFDDVVPTPQDSLAMTQVVNKEEESVMNQIKAQGDDQDDDKEATLESSVKVIICFGLI